MWMISLLLLKKLMLIFMLMTQSCITNFEQPEVILQSALTQLLSGLLVTNWSLSVPKSTSIVIGSYQRKALNLFFNDIALQQASTVKYLGVYIDQH